MLVLHYQSQRALAVRSEVIRCLSTDFASFIENRSLVESLIYALDLETGPSTRNCFVKINQLLLVTHLCVLCHCWLCRRRVFWFILRHVSIIPIIVSCLLAVNYPRAIPARVRNVFLALSFLLISAHDVAVCHRRNSSVYKQNAQVSRLSSLVALWFIIFGTQGVNPMLDYTSMNIIGTCWRSP